MGGLRIGWSVLLSRDMDVYMNGCGVYIGVSGVVCFADVYLGDTASGIVFFSVNSSIHHSLRCCGNSSTCTLILLSSMVQSWVLLVAMTANVESAVL